MTRMAIQSALFKTVECVAVWREVGTNPAAWSLWSAQPTQFMRLDPSEVDDKLIKEKGNFYEALLSTKDRTITPGGSAFQVPNTPEKINSAVNAFLHALEEETNIEAWIKNYAKLEPAQQIEVGTSMETIAQKIGALYTAAKPTLFKRRDEQNALIEKKQGAAPKQTAVA
jgi:hypothetical protein